MERNGRLFVTLLALVVLAFGTVVLLIPPEAPLSNVSTSTTKTTTSNQATVQSAPVNYTYEGGVYPARFTSSNLHGLVLGVKLNSTIISPGHTVAVEVSESNPTGEMLNVSSSNSWAYQGLTLNGCRGNEPMGFEVVRGYYTGAGAPDVVQVYEPPQSSGGIGMPCIGPFNLTGYSFNPLSTWTTMYCAGGQGSCGNLVTNITSTVNSYWVGNTPYTLPSGIYTILSGDEWGDSFTAHFAVAKPGSVLSVNESQMLIASALGPVPPFTPGGPAASFFIENNGFLPITSLQAEIGLPGINSPIPLSGFGVNASDPLLPGRAVSVLRTFFGAGFQNYEWYGMGLNGTLVGGTTFRLLLGVEINPIMYLVPGSSTAYCQGSGGYVPCLEDDYSAAEQFNCKAAAASLAGCTWEVVNASAPQYASRVTVWYPYSSGWGSCRYIINGDQSDHFQASCIPTNSTSFVIAVPQPPPL